MDEEKKDVKKEESVPSTEKKEEVKKEEVKKEEVIKEDVKEEGKEKIEEVNNNLRIALKKVREENKRLKKEVKEPEVAPEPQTQPEVGDVEQRFLTTEQTAMQTAEELEMLKLVQTDPFVKENLDLIETERNAGLTTSEAIKSVKAKVFDAMLVEQTSEPSVVPNSIKQEAEPESTEQPTNKDDMMARAIESVL